MPRYFIVLAGLAVLAFAAGAEAVVCSTNEYLEMNGAWTSSPAVKNAPKCTPCPTGMSNPAGVAGGYGDSAAPNLVALVAAKVAVGSANNDLLTWCDVDAGYYLATDTTATSPGVPAKCLASDRTHGSGATTSAKRTCTGAACAGGVEAPATVCVVRSNCAANQYLHTTVAASGSVAAKCTTCPSAGMSSLAGSATAVIGGVAASIGQQEAAVIMKSWCDVDAGYYLSTDSTAAIPGVAAKCSASDRTHGSGATTSAKLTCTGATCAGGVTTPAAACVVRSNCAANKYLHTTVAASGSVAAKCTDCPAGMSSIAGSPTAVIAGVAASIGQQEAAVIMKSWCDVDAGSYLSTDSTAAIPGVVSSCPTTRLSGGDGVGGAATTSAKFACTAATCASGDQDPNVVCVVRSNCAANQYLHTTAAANGAVAAKCTACPAGMSSLAGSPTAVIAGVATSLGQQELAVIMKTWCNVNSGYYLSTDSTAAIPGLTTQCLATETRSLTKLVTASGAGVQTEAACLVEKNINGATGPAGPAGSNGAAGAGGAAGAAGAGGAAGAVGAAGTASPAAPLSTVTAAVFGAVVPAILIFV